MKQLLPILLMILFINGFVRAAEDSEMDEQEYYPLSFANKQTILDWALEIYTPVEELMRNPNLTKEEIERIHKVLKRLMLEVDILDNKIGELPVEMDNRWSFESMRKYMSQVDKLYDKMIVYGFCKRDAEKMDKFFKKISDSVTGLPTILNDMFQPLKDAPEGLEIGAQGAMNVPDMDIIYGWCNVTTNLRQMYYLFYSKVVITEMKGFATLLHVYARRVSVDGSRENYTEVLSALNEEFHNRLDRYHTYFSLYISVLPQTIIRCHKKEPRRGIDFLELEHFSRTQILSLLEPKPSAGCGSCDRIPSPILLSRSKAYNCKDLGPAINVCSAAPGSSRDYMWIEDITQRFLYGEKTICDIPYYGIHEKCPLCFCSVDLDNVEPDFSHAVWRFSVTEQISDIWNNMVVTGIKFVTRDNAIHLQIQQAKFSDDALSSSTPVWKELDIKYDQGNENVTEMKYEPLTYYRKTLHLDAIALPNGHVVTGVRFALIGNDAFELQVHGTAFDLETGELNTLMSQWYNSDDPLIRYNDYQNPRMEVKLDSADDPTKANFDPKYDLTTNKKIKFTHTNLMKDLGQTTIPLLDSQPVEGKYPFPLSGVELYFRGVEGSGYVAPRLYILDLFPYLNMEVVHEEVVEA